VPIDAQVPTDAAAIDAAVDAATDGDTPVDAGGDAGGSVNDEGSADTDSSTLDATSP